jgi:hypothetical protein
LRTLQGLWVDVNSIEARISEWDTEDLRSILKSKWGRRFLWRFLKKCGIHQLGVDFENTNTTYFNAGMRNIGNSLYAQILEVNEEAFFLMTTEAKKEEKLIKQMMEKERKEQEAKEND